MYVYRPLNLNRIGQLTAKCRERFSFVSISTSHTSLSNLSHPAHPKTRSKNSTVHRKGKRMYIPVRSWNNAQGQRTRIFHFTDLVDGENLNAATLPSRSRSRCTTQPARHKNTRPLRGLHFTLHYSFSPSAAPERIFNPYSLTNAAKKYADRHFQPHRPDDNAPSHSRASLNLPRPLGVASSREKRR